MIPCKDCLMLPACKHKYYEELIFCCTPIARYLTVKYPKNHMTTREAEECHNTHRRRAKKLEATLNPSKWKLRDQTSPGYSLDILDAEDGRVYWGSTYF